MGLSMAVWSGSTVAAAGVIDECDLHFNYEHHEVNQGSM